ncbi:MAG: RNA polymerase subunit sigma [Pelagibaca sp.]|nr:RNA polymerase subunit sigma [Pelagibaca sp.]
MLSAESQIPSRQTGAHSSAVKAPLLSALYEEHHRWLFHWLCKKLRCREDAADTTQDTFFRLLGIPDLAKVEQPRALLVTTASRLMIDASRRRAVEQRYLELYLQQNEDAAAPSPEVITSVTDSLLMIAEVLDGLSPKARDAFLLSRLDGMRHAEIAGQLNVSVSSVKKYIATAMLHCHSLLGGA